MELRNDITLSSGRVITHTREPNGSQLATPTTGYYSMTDAEFAEYCDIVNSKTTKGVN